MNRQNIENKIKIFWNNPWVEGILKLMGALIILINLFNLISPLFLSDNIKNNVEEENILYYNIETPLKIFDDNAIIDVNNGTTFIRLNNIKINNISTNQLFLQTVRFWNSGKKPIVDFSIFYNFKDKNSFRIFNIIHNVSPKSPLLKVAVSNDSNSSIKCIYDYIETDGSFAVTFLTNKASPIEVLKKDKSFNLRQNASPNYNP